MNRLKIKLALMKWGSLILRGAYIHKGPRILLDDEGMSDYGYIEIYVWAWHPVQVLLRIFFPVQPVSQEVRDSWVSSEDLKND